MFRNNFIRYSQFALLLYMLMGFSPQANAQNRVLSDPNASPEAKALYCYLQSIAGKKILSGQMWSGWGFDELAYIQTNTGKQPAILGLDFIQQSVNNTQVTLATNWWKKGGIPTMMWHMGAPGNGEGYNSSKTSANINNCLDKISPEGKIFWADLAQKADLLQKLRDANVPILWRPFHELSGNWFWWSKEGGAQFKKLWIAMHDYYMKDRKLNNLIWVLCYSGDPNSAFFPGNEYVDISGGDEYAGTNAPQLALYNRVKNSIGGNSMPICLHECGIPPNPDVALSTGEMWSWWMIWHTSFVQNMDKVYLKKIFNHDVILTLDELPNIMTACGVQSNPTPTVTLTAPAENSAICFGASVTISATAAVSSGSISKVDFYDGNTLLGSDNSNTYSYAWNKPSVGVHTIRVISTSAANVASVAATSTFTVNASPVITFTAPSNNSTIIASPITLTASVVGANITSVQFYNGNTLVGSDPTTPYSYSWTNAVNGSYTLHAKATNTSTCTDTATVKTTISFVTGLNGDVLSSEVACFPNPFTQSFTINVPNKFDYVIFDLNGIEVGRGSGENTVSVGQNLPVGMYTVKIQNDSKSSLIKVNKL